MRVHLDLQVLGDELLRNGDQPHALAHLLVGSLVGHVGVAVLHHDAGADDGRVELVAVCHRDGERHVGGCMVGARLLHDVHLARRRRHDGARGLLGVDDQVVRRDLDDVVVQRRGGHVFTGAGNVRVDRSGNLAVLVALAEHRPHGGVLLHVGELERERLLVVQAEQADAGVGSRFVVQRAHVLHVPARLRNDGVADVAANAHDHRARGADAALARLLGVDHVRGRRYRADLLEGDRDAHVLRDVLHLERVAAQSDVGIVGVEHLVVDLHLADLIAGARSEHELLGDAVVHEELARRRDGAADAGRGCDGVARTVAAFLLARRERDLHLVVGGDVLQRQRQAVVGKRLVVLLQQVVVEPDVLNLVALVGEEVDDGRAAVLHVARRRDGAAAEAGDAGGDGVEVRRRDDLRIERHGHLGVVRAGVEDVVGLAREIGVVPKAARCRSGLAQIYGERVVVPVFARIVAFRQQVVDAVAVDHHVA